MRNPDRQFVGRYMLALAILVGMAAVQVTLADSGVPKEELDATQAAPSSPPEAVAAPLTGPEVYDAVCIACHAAPGVGGAPALGDSEAWTERIAQGMDTLIAHTLNGFSGTTGIMPRKGGRTDLSDAEIISAIEFMVEQVAQWESD